MSIEKKLNSSLSFLLLSFNLQEDHKRPEFRLYTLLLDITLRFLT